MQSARFVFAFLVLVAGAPAFARGGGVTVKEEKPGLLAKAKVSPDAATSAAKHRLPRATLTSAEIEEEDGRLIYSFDFKTKGTSGSDEVNVDAITGAVLSVEHESPDKEAAERAADAKAKRAR